MNNGADILFVDTGVPMYALTVTFELRSKDLRDRVDIAFGGDINLHHIKILRGEDVDIMDIGKAAIDAPLLDMKMEVIAMEDSAEGSAES